MDGTPPFFPAEEFDRRLAATLRGMADAGLDGLLLFAQESMYWLTGYDSFGFCFFQCLLVTGDRAHVPAHPARPTCAKPASPRSSRTCGSGSNGADARSRPGPRGPSPLAGP